MRLSKYYYKICFLLFISINTNAQQYSFINHGVEEGLSQSVVNTIVQDDYGYLWIGTMSGLNRYDGRTFELFDQKDSLAENWVSTSFKDSKGNLWFGHWAGGVSVFNWERQEISDWGFAQYSDFKSITAFCEDKQGNLYIATDGNGLLYLNTSTKEVYSFNKQGRLSSNYVLDLAIDDKEKVWIATDRGITVKNNDEQNTFRVLDTKDGLKSSLISKLEFLGNGLMAVGYYNNGFSIIDTKNNPYKIEHYTTDIEGIGNDEVQELYFDGEENLWIGTAMNGALEFNLTSRSFKHFDTEQGLNYFSVKSIIKDRESSIWIGTELGLNLFTGESFQLYNESHGLNNNIVWSVDASKDGGIWVGTNAGINYLKNGQFTSISELDDEIIITVYEDSRGVLWMGTPGNGLYTYNKKTEELTHILSDGFLPDNTVYSINEDKNGNIWIGTKKGAVRYKNQDNYKVFTIREGLGGNNIYRIFTDSKNRTWFAALGGALTLYENNKFKLFGEEDGINQRFIITISEDNSGNIWFGAYGGTIYRYDGKDFRAFQNGEENTLNTPYSIISDKSNRLWIGNSQGVTLLDPEIEEYKVFGRREGFMGVESNSNASAKDANGVIWIGTIMGLVKFSPSLVSENQEESITLINGLELKHKSVAFPDSAIFEYQDNNFTFEFTGISLKNPSKILYSYMLDGFDKEFSPPTNISRASYSNLLPGEYTLKVKSSNNDGIWNESPTTYTFRIDPPFYLTTWFYILVVISIVLLFLIIMRVRTASLKKAKAKLEETVEERTLQLKDKNDELAQKNKDITDSIRYAKRIQNAILPEPAVFSRLLPQSFVYFRPKDIVSGDFYWIDQVGSKTIVTAVDCTGHGVPGAFMSLVGYNGLNKIISEKKITDAGEILTLLDKSIADALKQTDKEGIKDGMDMSLCVIDPVAKQISYAGANNSLYAIQNDDLIETKPTKQAIGSYNKDFTQAFVSNTIPYKTGDQFYLFSDGFADQFGGEQGKKFKTRAFKDLLTSIKDESMEVQKERIGTTISKWKGELEQVDDIVVIGFKL